MNKVKFKPIIGFENNYEISNTGIIKNIKRNTILKPTLRKEYLGVSLCKNNTKKTFNIHRLVAIHFIDNPNNLPQINHIDGDKFNNNDWNLEWCNASYNIKHAYKTGLNKVSKFAILKIKERFNKKVIDTKTGIIFDSIKDAALANNLNPKTLSGILRGISKNKTNLTFHIKPGELPEL